jgi:hypothetical protein
LQPALEEATKKSIPDSVKKLVFVPLGMERSCYVLRKWEGNVAGAYWTGCAACEDRWRVHPEMAAAGLWATAEDVLKVVRAVQG